jgi:CBS domain-containing protein
MSVIHVLDFMVMNPIMVNLETPVKELAKLMKEKDIGSIILVKENKPYGIVTERDLVRRILAKDQDTLSSIGSDICSTPVITIKENEVIEEAIEKMIEYRIRRLVVVNDKCEVTGILTNDDIIYEIKRLSKELAYEYIMMTRSIRGHA